MKTKSYDYVKRIILFLALLCFFTAVPLILARTNAGPPPAPANIRCLGYEGDVVWVKWDDEASDEDNYRVERKIGSGSWEEIATVTPNDEGRYKGYKDTGVTENAPDRRYRVRAYRSSDNAYSAYSDVCNGRRIEVTDRFRFFYGIEGTDDCPDVNGRDMCLDDDTDSNGDNVYIRRAADAMQGSQDAFTRLGFTRVAGEHHKLDKVPINVAWCDGGGCASSIRSVGIDRIGLSPWLLQKPFDLDTRSGDPAAWLVSLHELFHAQQNRYGGVDDPADDWVYEGQARSIQDKVCIGPTRNDCEHFDDIATGSAGYVGQVNTYLGNPARPINETSYSAALFWTYLTEKYGTTPNDPVEQGMDLMVEFWEEAADNPGRDGIAVLNSTLANLGHSERFRDVWKDFAVASYAKDYNGPAKYQYEDMSQDGGAYDPVRLDVDRSLALGEQVVRVGEFLPSWSARYYEVRPANDVPIIDVQVTQDSSTAVYYTLLAIKGNDIVLEENVQARHFDYTAVNNAYDKVVLVVATLDNLANYRVSINGNQPTLQILSPTTEVPARVGDPGAPGKLRVTLQVLDPDGTPLKGVTLDNFSFRVGSEDVPAGNLITAAEVMGQYWFVLRAPAQSSGGTYDLEVSYSSALSATESSAVIYVPRTNADNMIVIDRSGSMDNDDKLEAAQAAARLYVDSWQNGDQVGVVSFNAETTLDMPLSSWLTSRQTALNAIDGLSAAGGTAIGDALRLGWDELDSDGTQSHDWAVVLLSDGLETAGTEDFQDVVNDLRAVKNDGDKVPLVHAVAVGPDADQQEMQRAAQKSGGTYHYVSVPIGGLARPQEITANETLFLDLARTYRMIATKVVGQQQFFRQTGPNSPPTVEQTVSIPVENGAAELVLSLNWTTSDGTMASHTLLDPDGQPVPEFETADATEAGHAVWRVTNPQGGTWELQLSGHVGGDVYFPLPSFLVQGSLHSEVTMDVFLVTPADEPVAGLPVTFLVSLTDNGPITGATIEATVEPQSIFGETQTLQLYDDGQHNDGEAGDGVYGAIFYDTQVLAPHVVTLVAQGTSPISGSFQREETFSFYPTHEDSDGDGLPDAWEMYYGTDPNVDDANADPDFDGLPNSTEHDSGTDPHNPDTDGGGASDGSDPDPLDPSDDDVERTWAKAHPGIGQVWVKYALPQEYARVDLYRGSTPDGPFSYLDGGFGDFVSGVYTDTAVTNGTTYCYVVVARGFNFHESQTGATCTTPKSDPWSPHGLVEVEDQNGDGTVPTADVTLLLWAADSVDPEHEQVGETLALPPDDSASGVVEMMISNRADMEGGTWEPYAPTKAWTLAKTSGLATVYAKYRDAAGNESEVVAATIYVGSDGSGGPNLYLPMIIRP